MRRLAVLGSTGSIGRQTLEVARRFPRLFRVIGLAAGGNTGLLASQMAEFHPEFVCCRDNGSLPQGSHKFLPVEDIAAHPDVDIAVIGISGTAGLGPTLAAVRAGKTIALANKESLVMAGEIVSSEAKQSGSLILPVDSEHSAIWQCLKGEKQNATRLLLTASGGPFYHYSPQKISGVTVEQALNHPSWRMGHKITIDSATLMNKGLEVIEARWLFDMPFDRISVVIHPQSIVHSMVEFRDGSVKALLSRPDMRLPIQYALTYPKRLSNPDLPFMDWQRLTTLTFEPPDLNTFPALKLAIEAGKKGGTCPAVLCAADEAAVALFLEGRIRFTAIAALVEEALGRHQSKIRPDLEEIMAATVWARETVRELAAGSKTGLLGN